jgi:uncharacterized protein YndB with AHSA1/START domain
MQDRIERSVQISAPLDRVWRLVSEPGWWVTESTTGTPTKSAAPAAEWTPGTVVEVPTESGRAFPILVVALDEPRFAAFRWASQFPGEQPSEGNSTLIEFTLTPGDDAVEVRVVETGFANLVAPDEVREAGFADNSSGWEHMLSWLDQQLTA